MKERCSHCNSASDPEMPLCHDIFFQDYYQKKGNVDIPEISLVSVLMMPNVDFTDDLLKSKRTMEP